MKQKFKFYLRIIFSMPGIIIHEFSHMLFCLLMGIRVYKVCFFQLKNPTGFVEHSRPKNFIQTFFISVGPFIFGTILSLGFLWFTIYSCRGVLQYAPTLGSVLTTIVALWFGLAVAVNCFPSDGDGKVLLSETNRHVFQRFNPFAIILYPFILIIKLANYLKKFYFDWIYAVFLLGIAIYVNFFKI